VTTSQPQALAQTLSDEDLNIISEERSKLLAELKEMMPAAKVSPTLWACLQIGEIDRVKETISAAKSFPLLSSYIFGMSNSIQQLPLLCKYMKLSFFYKVDIKPL
jgi:hypothetical protein